MLPAKVRRSVLLPRIYGVAAMLTHRLNLGRGTATGTRASHRRARPMSPTWLALISTTRLPALTRASMVTRSTLTSGSSEATIITPVVDGHGKVREKRKPDQRPFFSSQSLIYIPCTTIHSVDVRRTLYVLNKHFAEVKKK